MFRAPDRSSSWSLEASACLKHPPFGFRYNTHNKKVNASSSCCSDRVGRHFVMNPVDVTGDTCVDAGLIPLAAAITPADDAHQGHFVIVAADERTARVSLEGRSKGI